MPIGDSLRSSGSRSKNFSQLHEECSVSAHVGGLLQKFDQPGKKNTMSHLQVTFDCAAVSWLCFRLPGIFVSVGIPGG